MTPRDFWMWMAGAVCCGGLRFMLDVWLGPTATVVGWFKKRRKRKAKQL